MKKYLIALLVFTTIVSCEKVIDVPLEDSERRYVIEAIIKDNPGDNFIKISKTGSVYEESNFEKITGANVFLQDKLGNYYNFGETSPGFYTNPTFAAAINDEYTLTIIYNTDTFTSVGTTYYKPTIDSLTYIEQIGSFGIGDDTTYLVFFNYVDEVSQTNYYRINSYLNGVKEDAYYVVNDKLNNGQTYTQPLFASTVEKGDTVTVEVMCIDRGNYDYFISLPNATSSGDPFSPIPANPVSNINGNAIGYFGIYTTDTMTIILPQ